MRRLLPAAINVGATRSLGMARGFDAKLGPLALFGVTAASTRGTYEFGCRVLEPSTGEVHDAASVQFRVEWPCGAAGQQTGG